LRFSVAEPRCGWPPVCKVLRGMVKLVNLSLVMSSLLGCGSNQSNGVVEDSGPDVASTAVDGGACTWPSAFTSTGAEQASGPIAVGCWAHSTSGPASGGISSCSSAEYSLDCVGELTSNAPIPAPSSSLGCRVLPLPTPSNQSYYCCPCGQVGDVNPLESGVSPDAALAPGDSAPVVSDGAGAGDAGACYPLFHACTNNGDCCAPNRCLNITGTPECQQESPQLGGPEVGPEIPNTAVDAGACVWPASVTSTGDASTVGCWAQATFNICEVPNGSSVNAQNGTITGPDGKPVTDACHDACSASEYALTCTSATLLPSTIPEPDSSLGCTVIPVPTASDVLYYCCPCGQGQ